MMSIILGQNYQDRESGPRSDTVPTMTPPDSLVRVHIVHQRLVLRQKLLGGVLIYSVVVALYQRTLLRHPRFDLSNFALCLIFISAQIQSTIPPAADSMFNNENSNKYSGLNAT